MDKACRIVANPAARAQRIVQQHEDAHQRRQRTDEALEDEAVVVADALERETDPVRVPALRSILKKLNAPDDPSMGENPMLSIVFGRWRAERQPPARTWMEWTKARERSEQVAGGDLPVREVTKGHVRAFKAALMETTARNGDTKLAPTSIQKNLTALRFGAGLGRRSRVSREQPGHGDHARRGEAGAVGVRATAVRRGRSGETLQPGRGGALSQERISRLLAAAPCAVFRGTAGGTRAATNGRSTPRGRRGLHRHRSGGRQEGEDARI